MTDTSPAPPAPNTEALPRWSVADVHESLTARTFVDAMERSAAEVQRLEALFDEHGVRAVEPRRPTDADVAATEAVIDAYNSTSRELETIGSVVYATVSTNSRDETADSLQS